MKYGRYKILSSLGKGSMGEVYLAHDPHIDRKVALKVLHKDHLSSKQVIKRFIKEAKAIGRLSYPDIVSVYDVGQDHGTIYIAMEYLEGQPLNMVMKSRKFDIPSIIHIGRQIAVALDYAHRKGVVHRDIKPSNLMITEDDKVKITDFGIAHFEDPAATLKTRSGDILGTPAYMSPEQVSGKKVDCRSDIYSLGVILYELAAGQRPFVERNITALFKAIAEHHILPLKKVNPEIPSALSAIITKSMRKYPDGRYRSGTELASALTTYQHDGKVDGRRRWNFGKNKILRWSVTFVLFMVPAVIVLQLVYKRDAKQPVQNIQQQATAVVNISSEPPNANIYLNNIFKGRTPMRCELPLGLYDVQLTLADHYETEAQIDINESGEIPIHLRLMSKE